MIDLKNGNLLLKSTHFVFHYMILSGIFSGENKTRNGVADSPGSVRPESRPRCATGDPFILSECLSCAAKARDFQSEGGGSWPAEWYLGGKLSESFESVLALCLLHDLGSPCHSSLSSLSVMDLGQRFGKGFGPGEGPKGVPVLFGTLSASPAATPFKSPIPSGGAPEPQLPPSIPQQPAEQPRR